MDTSEYTALSGVIGRIVELHMNTVTLQQVKYGHTLSKDFRNKNVALSKFARVHSIKRPSTC